MSSRHLYPRDAANKITKITGDPLASEPCCIYQPKHWKPQPE
jgi:hypothetical protein